jgi:hypothetical protein
VSGDVQAAVNVLTTAAEMVVDATGGPSAPEAVAYCEHQLDSTRHRLIEVASEMRGISCDFEVIAMKRNDHPAVERAARYIDQCDDDMPTALTAVVDLLIATEHALARLAAWADHEASA